MKLAFLLSLAALPASAATLRPYTALSEGVVRLSDLFDGADNRPLGPAPGPGGRITVEAPQLTAIAHMFGVDWHASGPGDRAVLERPGRTLVREDVLTPLRQILEEAGAPRDSDIELPSVNSPLLPRDAKPALEFSATQFDPGTGRFTTLLTATVDGMPPAQMRLSGRVQAMTELPVSRRAMMPGDIFTAADLQWTRLRTSLARADIVRQPAQAIGQALRHPIQPGQPIALADLGRPIIVLKGAPLLLQLDGPGIQLTAQGVAAEPGGLGERIHVINPYSRAIIEAEITGPGAARVTPGTQPITPASRIALQ